jgi:predicted Rossmann fold nucleotide-binding protein DprA/Smf involved in DNA uptake
MLLTLSFGKTDSAGSKPLSNNEWARFAIWLKDHHLEPASLLKGDLNVLLASLIDRTITIPRLRALLGRGAAFGLALEKWHRAGLWILARSDPEYPDRLKRRLRTAAPPALFGCGNKGLLNSGGIAVVGSREASEDDLKFAALLGEQAAAQGFSLVSGGARGVDQSAMLAAVEKEGTAVGVLADSLLESATSSRYRKYIMSGDLALVSSFNPEAGFNIGNAMSRNRYIYCLADAAIVVSSTMDKGGTWHGALEDLKNAWVPLWVKPTKANGSANVELVRRGARPLPEGSQSLSVLFADPDAASPLSDRELLPSAPRPQPRENIQPLKSGLKNVEGTPSVAASDTTAMASQTMRQERDLYSLFVSLVGENSSAEPLTTAEIASRLGLEKSQINAWLKRAVRERKLEKLTRPVRYRLVTDLRYQASLFADEP